MCIKWYQHKLFSHHFTSVSNNLSFCFELRIHWSSLKSCLVVTITRNLWMPCVTNVFLEESQSAQLGEKTPLRLNRGWQAHLILWTKSNWLPGTLCWEVLKELIQSLQEIKTEDWLAISVWVCWEMGVESRLPECTPAPCCCWDKRNSV